MQLSELLLLLIELFLSAATLLTNHEVSVAIILDTPLLDGIDFDVLASEIIFRLSNLTLQVLDHLLASLQHLFFRVVVRVCPV